MLPEGGEHAGWRREAVEAFGRAQERNPSWSLPATNRSIVRLDLGRAAAGAGEDPAPHWRAGVADLNPIIVRLPREAAPWGNRALLKHELASLTVRRGQDPRALLLDAAGDAETAATLDAGNLGWHTEAALIRLELGFAVLNAGGDGHVQWELAWAHIAEGLRLSPDYWKSHLLAGQVRAAQGRLEESLAHFEACAKTQPTHPDVVNAIAQIKRALGR